MTTPSITLHTGETVLLDPDDYQWAQKSKWYLHSNGYAIRNNLAEKYMHRAIIGVPPLKPGLEVDHINGNKLDNRKSNLRVVTRSENCYNQRIRKDNRSGVRGVSFDQSRNKWVVQIHENGKRILLKRYADFGKAVRAREKYLKQL